TLVSGITVTLIALVSYGAKAGGSDAGRLGNLAYMEGLQRNHNDVTLAATVAILVVVFIIQFIGDALTFYLDTR
ncbi:ABC transporter permease, partial [Cronobacter sakazakii]